MIKVFLIFSFITATATAKLNQQVDNDIRLLFQSVGINAPLEINYSENNSGVNKSTFNCSNSKLSFNIYSSASEASSTVYFHMRKLGFLFPHPRQTILPQTKQVLAKCNSQFDWKPRLKERGFHLHAAHSSEYVEAYFLGHLTLQNEINRWMVRNQQNIIQIVMLDLKEDQFLSLKNGVINAKNWGLKVGLEAGFKFFQQRYFKFIGTSIFSNNLEKDLASFDNKFKKFISFMPDFDYITFNQGTTEFTPVKPENSIAWMNHAAAVLKSHGKEMYVKVHVSSNKQNINQEYGNTNFLPKYTIPEVGIQPHTVFFYNLNDQNAPFYGRKDYNDMRAFYLEESKKRKALYYPETSYFIFMDIDAPIFLTDYLISRTQDVDWMQANGLDGLVNFTTGQEMGYWLFDYQSALLADPESKNNPYYALDLLGEKRSVWQKILKWQNKYIKNEQLIQTMFFSNLLDYLEEPVHEHILISKFAKHPDRLVVLEKMYEAILNAPDFSEIKNSELKLMNEITLLRLKHAYSTRLAAINRKTDKQVYKQNLETAKALRLNAQEKIDLIFENHYRYQDVPGLYARKWKNPTSYSFGYLFTAKTLFLWQKEEEIVEKNKKGLFAALYKNIVNMGKIVLPR